MLKECIQMLKRSGELKERRSLRRSIKDPKPLDVCRDLANFMI